jgi:alkaline phosphatase
VKWRNQLLAFFCLIVFAALGVLYFQHWVVQKPFGIILFIGEGLAPERLAATRAYIGGSDTRLALDSMSNLALVRNGSRNFAVADQAAAATAIATGIKVDNHAVAVDSGGKPLATLVDLARDRRRAIGLVTDANLTSATCAAFYAHATNPNDTDDLARQLTDGGKIDIALGADPAPFIPETKGGRRQDRRDLLLELRGNGFDIARTRGELEGIPAWQKPKLLGIFGGPMTGALNQFQEWSDQPGLPDMVRRAIELLQYNPRGYLLLVAAGQMRAGAEINSAEKTLNETAQLDRAVAVAQRYGGGKSTIIVCGDTAIGGLNLNGFPFRKDSGIALLGLNPAGQPWMTWATGPNGSHGYGADRLTPPETISQSDNPPKTNTEKSEPAAFYTKSALDTVEDVVALGSGPGSEAIRGCIDNTDIFKILRDEL